MDVLNAVLIGGKGFEPYEVLYSKIPDFERKYSIKVNILHEFSHPELNAFKDNLNGGEDVDVISSHTSFLRSYKHLYLDLTETDPESTKIMLNDLPGPLKKAVTVKGEVLIAPRFIDVSSLHYRTSVFNKIGEEPPKTWDELLQVAIKIKENKIDMYPYTFAARGHALVGRFMEILHSFGGKLIDGEHFAFYSQEGIEALQFLADLHVKYKITHPRTPDFFYDDVSQAFKTGEVVMVLDWPGWDYVFRDPRQSSIWDDFSIALPPQGKGGLWVYGGSHGLSVIRWSKRKGLATTFVLFMVSTENQYFESKSQGFLPARTSVFAMLLDSSKDNYFENHRLSVYRKIIEEAYLPVKVVKWREFTENIWPILNKAVRGEIKAEEALKNAYEKVKHLEKFQAELGE
ncbi:extracellular solute-binding protein [Vulcanisaeta souniana]|uniref:Sugar ABC transporter substrate-binding protein n=1 Tax=Vulcanisaeta souniana JCM 11219 TaxID=1293586 RepID=A0A830EAS3_9CREN|nr:extracellular solute-binding protein [Vulcanisaeta souniana]BDR93548.1 sugar ABC transporter substrate-binding protein [Vulcanisaeta souniana JCM 11219]GGI87396.1 sugar ABC transporter substrate-binding protein [Vulcanisaeta souniana JCM 11219]